MGERDLFIEALQQADPTARSAYLDAACAGDDALRRRVLQLLAQHEKYESFLLDAPVQLPQGPPIATIDEPLREASGTIIGPYKLLEPIGEGGMGTVWMAQQTAPVKRLVAVKLIKAGMDSKQVLARFEAERQALALMDHPNIAKVLDADTTASGRPYFVMELVKGVPITRYCDEHRLTPRQRLELFVPVCQAIQHAHQKGVIHRDLKPSNVLVALYDGKPVPKVIDFGVAKAVGQALTEKTLVTGMGAIVGTLEYMSPEQAQINQLDIDTRSDIYSLGVLLYELLTGSPPFSRKDLERAGILEMLRVIREQEPSKPSTKLSTADGLPTLAANRGTEPAKLTRLVRGELDWIVMKALEKDRNRRYESANGFAMDVQRYLVDEPVQACPPSAWYRLTKFARRNKAVLTTVVLVVVALLLGAGVSIWQAVRATRAEIAAKEDRDRAVRAEEDAVRAQKAEEVRAAAEQQARREAQARQAEINAVLTFVVNKVFAAARPIGVEGGLGHDVTLREAVESAVPYVEMSFRDQPLVEARLRLTLGVSFTYLGDAKRAAEQFEAARALFARHLGPDDSYTIWAMNDLADRYEDLGRYADALKLHEETLALRQAKFGADHPSTFGSLVNIANCYHELGRDREALPKYEAALARMRVKIPEHPFTFSCMAGLANTCEKLGRDADALKLREETLALRKAKLGPKHPDTLGSMAHMARSYYKLGRLTEALKLREEVLALRKANLGPKHRETLQSMMDLADNFAALDRGTEALKLLEQTLALQREQLDPDHPDTLATMNDLADRYKAAKRPADALRLAEEAFARSEAKLGRHHLTTLTAMQNVADCYTGLRRHNEALKLRQEVLAQLKDLFGPNDVRTLYAMDDLARSYHFLGKEDEALKVSEAVLPIRKTTQGPDHPDTIRAMQCVVQSLITLGRGAEAIPLIDEWLPLAAMLGIAPSVSANLMGLRLGHFVQAEDAAGCRQTAEMWEKLKRTDPRSLYNAAEMRAVTAAVIRRDRKVPQAESDRLAKAEADRATAWLKQAVAAGFADVAYMKKDPNLDALRDRADFQELLRELESRKPSDQSKNLPAK